VLQEKKARKKRMKFNIHAGHNPDGKVACGAVGLIRESTAARAVKEEVVRQLAALGHEVHDCTCDDGTSQSDVLTKIVKKCNANKVDWDISIHLNSGANDTTGNGKTTGVEAYIFSETTAGAREKAQSICNAIEALGFKNRGVKVNGKLYVLKKTNAPAILIECCFVDDADDVALFDAKEVATAIVYGLTGQKYVETIESAETDADAASDGAETTTGDASALYRVQVGAYSVKSNAENMAAKLKAAGFDAAIVRA
jgi:N-acetylmuramoyl-L-alanine amidase